MSLRLSLNGESREFPSPLTVTGLLERLELDPAKVAVERNLEIVPKSAYASSGLSEGDRLEIVHFIGGGSAPAETLDNPLIVAGHELHSRLIIGTGKYKDYAENAAALEASGAEMVTVALRRVNVMDPGAPKLVDFIDPKKFVYLPNTAGCFTAEDALRTLRLAREAGGWTLVKLEVLGDKKTLYPDMVETLRATQVLIKEGFQVMVYCSDDPLMAKRLSLSTSSASTSPPNTRRCSSPIAIRSSSCSGRTIKSAPPADWMGPHNAVSPCDRQDRQDVRIQQPIA